VHERLVHVLVGQDDRLGFAGHDDVGRFVAAQSPQITVSLHENNRAILVLDSKASKAGHKRHG